MIPRIIHYCWFGKNRMPSLAKKCIKSWKKYCPDYRIVRWDESIFDINNAPRYVKEAYEAKKWAFVTDYVRLYALVKYGGVYMDTDVEVIKPFDRFLNNDAFSGFESNKAIPTGIMGSVKGFHLFLDFLNGYNNRSFIKEDGSFDLTTNVEVITNCCLNHGLVLNNSFQVIDGFALYPSDYFCPKDWQSKDVNITKNTYVIHHFSASWHDKMTKQHFRKQRRHNKIKQILIGVFGIKVYDFLNKFYKKIKHFFK